MAETVSDWQSECNDIKSRVAKMYETASWSDCVFLFGTDTLLPAHRNVLSAASPVFATMFYGGMPETGGPIRVEDIQPDIFADMLRYIYTDVINIRSYDDACALYYAAHKYTLQHLQKQCLDYLIAQVTPEHCCLAYEFAEMFGETDLSSACENIMKTQTEEVLRSVGFLRASLKTVQFIYSMDKLQNVTELEMFTALEEYSDSNLKLKTFMEFHMARTDKCEDPWKNGNSVNNPSKDGKHGQVTVRDIVKLIRFLTMTPEEFASAPAISPLLTQEEKLSLMINLNDCKSNVPLPEGLSTMKERRCEEKTVHFSFVCPDCQHLKENSVIRFPAVHALNIKWEFFVQVQPGDLCSFGLYRDEESPRHIQFRALPTLVIKSQSSYSDSRYRFDEDAARLQTERFGREFVIGRFRYSCIDLKNRYMKNGAITFEVTLNITFER